MGIERLVNIIVLIALLVGFGEGTNQTNGFPQGYSFVHTSGTHFSINGKPYYFNGFNAYWLMYMAYDPFTRWRVSDAFQKASKVGMNVARTMAFSDGGYRPLQFAPGSYDEKMFWGLDFVISEANKYGIRLILSLVNGGSDLGGRKQYVQWARERGQNLNNEDDFYTNPVVKGYYKNHVMTILTRVNKVTGVAYRNDPTIFAWELMNEPRCWSDLSGWKLQGDTWKGTHLRWRGSMYYSTNSFPFVKNWITEMAKHVKSIDSNHLLEVGLEGFYGESKKQSNPNSQLIGTDFISNNRVPEIDFSTIHLYPDLWLPNQSEQARATFVKSWIEAHIQDSNKVLRKPLLLAEFGTSSRSAGYNVGVRDGYYKNIFDTVYVCAIKGGPCSGTVFWQLMTQGMENMGDGYEVVLDQSPSTTYIIAKQSRRLSSLNK